MSRSPADAITSCREVERRRREAEAQARRRAEQQAAAARAAAERRAAEERERARQVSAAETLPCQRQCIFHGNAAAPPAKFVRSVCQNSCSSRPCCRVPFEAEI